MKDVKCSGVLLLQVKVSWNTHDFQMGLNTEELFSITYKIILPTNTINI